MENTTQLVMAMESSLLANQLVCFYLLITVMDSCFVLPIKKHQAKVIELGDCYHLITAV